MSPVGLVLAVIEITHYAGTGMLRVIECPSTAPERSVLRCHPSFKPSTTRGQN
jgi:hypothetical protein